MAISQAICNSFKQELLQEEHDFDNDTFKIALYSSSASLGASTTAYTSTNEVSGTGYSAGGATLTAAAPTLSGSTAILDFTDVEWTSATISGIRGALIYNSSNSNKSVCVLDFGGDNAVSSGTFTVAFPTADASNAIIRIS